MEAYDVEYRFRKEDWTYTEARKLLKNPKIALRLEQIREKFAKSNLINLEHILFELEQARFIVQSRGKIYEMMKATMLKAQIVGLDKPKSNDQLQQQEKQDENS